MPDVNIRWNNNGTTTAVLVAGVFMLYKARGAKPLRHKAFEGSVTVVYRSRAHPRAQRSLFPHSLRMWEMMRAPASESGRGPGRASSKTRFVVMV